MKTIGIVCDTLSAEQKAALIRKLCDQDKYVVKDLGEISIQAEAGENQLVAQITEIINSNLSKGVSCIIGLSTSGNGIQIYANKIDGMIAVPCSTVTVVRECVAEASGARLCDIPSYLSLDVIIQIIDAFTSMFEQ